MIPYLRFLIFLALLQAGVLAAWADPVTPRYLAVVGGTLIDGTGAPPVLDSAIIIEEGRVRAAGPRRQIRIPPGSVPLDATGLTVLPGFVDMHVHMVEAVDPAQFIRYGVTSVRHLGDTTLSRIEGLASLVESGLERGPHIYHCGLFVVSRPPLDDSIYPRDALRRFAVMEGPEDAEKVIRRLLAAGASVVKVKTEMAPNSFQALGRAAAAAGLPISFDSGGNSDTYDALTAIRAGARGVEHLSGIRFEDEDEVGRVLEAMLESRAFAVPTLVVLSRTYSAARVAARADFAREFAARGGLVVAGTDTPTHGVPAGESLHREMELLVEAGLSPMQALVAATGGAGRALGRQGLVGTLEAGSHADFVLLYGDPLEEIGFTRRIFQVYKDGRLVHPDEAPPARRRR